MGDTVDPVQGPGELTHGWGEPEQADHSVDVDEEDWFCLVRYQGVAPLSAGNHRLTCVLAVLALKGKAQAPIARTEPWGL